MEGTGQFFPKKIKKQKFFPKRMTKDKSIDKDRKLVSKSEDRFSVPNITIVWFPERVNREIAMDKNFKEIVQIHFPELKHIGFQTEKACCVPTCQEC